MLRNTRLVLAGTCALALLPLAACADKPAPTVSTPVAAPTLAATDADFVASAEQTGLTEIQLGQLAQTKAASAHVKSYAAMLVSDHTANLDQLKTAVAGKGVTLPTEPSDAQKSAISTLQGESGKTFDKDLLAALVSGHQDALAAYQTEAQSGTDADIKKYATDTIPALQHHLALAKHLQGGSMTHKAMHHHKAS